MSILLCFTSTTRSRRPDGPVAGEGVRRGGGLVREPPAGDAFSVKRHGPSRFKDLADRRVRSGKGEFAEREASDVARG